MTSNISAALDYAQRGWHVFPVHSTDESGACSCGNATCSNPGKHPRTISGLKDASTDESTIRIWLERWPDSNIAVRTGEISGIVVLDIDIKKGAKGPESLAALEAEYSALPKTLTARTWSGGIHKIYKHPGTPVKNRTGFLPGLDIRGDGGYIVVPPSSINGSKYEWIDNEFTSS